MKTQYSYDYENRLTEITDGSDTVAKFSYDALGRRIEKIEYAYGKMIAITDDGADDTWLTSDDTTASASAKGNPVGFTGQRLDNLDSNNLLIMYYKNRYYLVVLNN